MHKRQLEGRSGGALAAVRPKSGLLAQALSLGLLAACLLTTGAPVAAQVVDNGTLDESLRCTDVFVDGVDPNDSLNVREGPGTIYSVVLTLEPAAPAVATGLTQSVGGGIWYQIGIGDCEPVGWVNSSFLGADESGVGTPIPSTSLAPVAGPDGEVGDVTESSTDPEADPRTEPETPAESDLRLSPFAIALLGLGALGLATGITMFVRGRHSARDDGPPPGMVGPPGGPYFLARVDKRTVEPRTITVGGIPKSEQTRRADDPPFRADESPVSAFPSLPDLASEAEDAADNISKPAVRFFDTNSLGAGNGAEDENGS